MENTLLATKAGAAKSNILSACQKESHSTATPQNFLGTKRCEMNPLPPPNETEEQEETRIRKVSCKQEGPTKDYNSSNPGNSNAFTEASSSSSVSQEMSMGKEGHEFLSQQPMEWQTVLSPSGGNSSKSNNDKAQDDEGSRHDLPSSKPVIENAASTSYSSPSSSDNESHVSSSSEVTGDLAQTMHDKNKSAPIENSSDFVGMALKQWSVYLGNVLLNFIQKECKYNGKGHPNVVTNSSTLTSCQAPNTIAASQSTSSSSNHVSPAVHDGTTLTPTGYCPCCRYHNQMASQQNQLQNQQSQFPMPRNHLSQSIINQLQNQQHQTQLHQSQNATMMPPLHQGYYNYGPNLSPFLPPNIGQPDPSMFYVSKRRKKKENPAGFFIDFLFVTLFYFVHHDQHSPWRLLTHHVQRS